MCDLRSGLGIIFYTVEQIGFAVFVFLLYWNGECMVFTILYFKDYIEDYENKNGVFFN